MTRWQIGEAGTLNEDLAVPAQPVFGLSLVASQGGTIELSQIAFTDLSNTKTISAGTFTFHYYNELLGPPSLILAIALSTTDTTITLPVATSAAANDFIPIDREVLQITSLSPDGLTLQIARGMHGTDAADHSSGTTIYLLQSRVLIVPFIRNFLGSPSSGDWNYSLSFPNARIATAELVVTNSQGNSPTGTAFFTDSIDYGIRTLSGGQYSFQVAGFLAIQTGAAPDISIEGPHAIRDIFAVSKAAPFGGDINIAINLDKTALCSLSIPSGSTISNAVRGLLLPPLVSGSLLSIDITSVGATVPGSDLTVVIRL